MANVLIERQTLEDIADAVREKTEKTYPREIPQEIDSISASHDDEYLIDFFKVE